MKLTTLIFTIILFISCNKNQNLNEELKNTTWFISSIEHSNRLNVLSENIIGATWQFYQKDSISLKTDPKMQFANFDGKYQFSQDSLTLDFEMLRLSFGIIFKSNDSLVLIANNKEEFKLTLNKKQ